MQCLSKLAFCAFCGKVLPAEAGFCPSCGKAVGHGTSPQVTLAATSGVSPVVVQSYDSTAPRPNYASEWDRIVAVVIDTIIAGILSLVLLIPLGFSRVIFPSGPFLFFGLDLLIFWFFWLLYFTYFEATTGQTLGKQMVHIRVVDETTMKPLDFPRALIRNIFRIIDWLPFLYLLGIIVIAMDREKRRLGDMAAHSIVVKA
jgi:uncharacterized RDD family membrane protein YckC